MRSRNAEFNAFYRGVYIADNLDFLRSLNTASVDLVCIAPPFAKNYTFTGDKLKPPLRADERENEARLLFLWGIATPEQADEAGIAWPDDPKARGGYAGRRPPPRLMGYSSDCGGSRRVKGMPVSLDTFSK